MTISVLGLQPSPAVRRPVDATRPVEIRAQAA